MNNLMLLEEAGTFGQINAVLSLLYAPATLALCLVGVASRRFAPRLVLPLVLMALVPVLVSLIGVLHGHNLMERALASLGGNEVHYLRSQRRSELALGTYLGLAAVFAPMTGALLVYCLPSKSPPQEWWPAGFAVVGGGSLFNAASDLVHLLLTQFGLHALSSISAEELQVQLARAEADYGHYWVWAVLGVLCIVAALVMRHRVKLRRPN